MFYCSVVGMKAPIFVASISCCPTLVVSAAGCFHTNVYE